ncbi:hypothetical protein U9M48_005110 [Paspalum notatum var. saurae]|uniref:RanBP2-type domain-containing protein n=1 Tax=Paspalum notatum var. saurae TaxID=547442 RepID=A0AAQ3SLP4_PASNO
MGSVTSIHRPPRGIALPAAASKPRAMMTELLQLVLQALFAPATAALLAANVLVYFRPGPLDGILPSEEYIGFNPADLKTMLSTFFYHESGDHLFGNMHCLLHTGVALESAMGTADFTSMVATLLVLSHGIAVLLSKSKAVMALVGHDADKYYGSIWFSHFSGIIFAMETVLACSRSHASFEHRMSSISVPAEYAGLLLKSARLLCKLGMCADFFILQAMVPEADLLGHLGGLLAGFLYHLLRRSLKGADPLTWLISRGVRILTSAPTGAQDQEHLMSSVIQCNITKSAAAAGGGDGGRRREFPREDIGFNPADLKTMLSAFYHVSEDHLSSNMEWLLNLGVALESSMGTADFASMVATLVALSHGVAALLSKSKPVMALLGVNHDDYYGSIGFSGIIFAMDAVLTCSRSFAAFERRMSGMSVPAEYAGFLLKSARVLGKLGMCADLFICQAMIPEADFLGHLGGLLAGFLYHLLKRSLKGAEPLTWLISRGVRTLTSAATCDQEHLMSSDILSNIIIFIKYCCSSATAKTAAAGGGGGGGGRRREYPRGIWTCSTCNNYNSLATDICEMCSTMREDRAFSRRRWQLATSSTSLLI